MYSGRLGKQDNDSSGWTGQTWYNRPDQYSRQGEQAETMPSLYMVVNLSLVANTILLISLYAVTTNNTANSSQHTLQSCVDHKAGCLRSEQYWPDELPKQWSAI